MNRRQLRLPTPRELARDAAFRDLHERIAALYLQLVAGKQPANETDKERGK